MITKAEWIEALSRHTKGNSWLCTSLTAEAWAQSDPKCCLGVLAFEAFPDELRPQPYQALLYAEPGEHVLPPMDFQRVVAGVNDVTSTFAEVAVMIDFFLADDLDFRPEMQRLDEELRDKVMSLASQALTGSLPHPWGARVRRIVETKAPFVKLTDVLAELERAAPTLLIW